MLLGVIIVVLWILAGLFALGLCLAADRGDQQAVYKPQEPRPGCEPRRRLRR